MENKDLIAIDLCCTHYSVEISFIRSLNTAGLIETVSMQGIDYIHSDNMNRLEKMIRLHQDLDINLEGIEAIVHLLDRINNMQEELGRLRNRLNIYEYRHVEPKD